MDVHKTTVSGECPAGERASLNCTAAIIGTKWTAQLVLALSHGVRRFSELKEQAGGLNPRTLSARLDELEERGIVTKTTFAEMPPRVEYALTHKGMELVPVIKQMVTWGDKYISRDV